MDHLGRPSTQSLLKRALLDSTFRTRLIRYSLGLPTPLDTEDRRILEQVIFKYFRQQEDVHTVLFVGTDWYTRHYEKSYFPDRTFWTIDVSPSARKFGARLHLTCSLEEAGLHFSERYFDLIVCNGVFGFGLDTHDACEQAFDTCFRLLRRGGHFVLGWNDAPTQAQCSLAEIDSLRQFRPWPLPPLGTDIYACDTPLRHVFQFYEKPADAG